MPTPSLSPSDSILKELNLPRQSSMNAATGDGHILSTRFGRFFQNSIMHVTWQPDRGIVIKGTDGRESFMEMLTRRNDAQANRAVWNDSVSGFKQMLSSGLELSNVGVSLAITTSIDGKRYAVLARRRLPEGKNRLMLISGFVDARKLAKEGSVTPMGNAASIMVNAVAEGAEELNPLILPGWASKTNVKGSIITQVADELRLQVGNQLESVDSGLSLVGGHDSLDYHPDMWWTLRTGALPGFIHNVFRPPVVDVDGTVFKDVGFQVHTHTNSGQIIIGMECAFDMRVRDFLSLLHAEDGPLSNAQLKASLKLAEAPPDLLATRLDRSGLILCELDEASQLTPNLFNFFEGSLIRATHLGDLDSIYLSDAFVPAGMVGDLGFRSPNRMSGFVDRPELPATQYFRMRV